MRVPARTSLPRSVALPLQVFGAGVAVVLIVVVLVFVLLSRWVQRNAETVVQRELEQSADLVAQVLSGRQRSLTGGARVFVQGPSFRSFIADRRQQQQSSRIADSLRYNRPTSVANEQELLDIVRQMEEVAKATAEAMSAIEPF